MSSEHVRLTKVLWTNVKKNNYLILTFILFSFLVPEFKKPIGIMLTRGTLPKLQNLSTSFPMCLQLQNKHIMQCKHGQVN